MSFINDIERYVPKNSQEAQDKKVITDCIKLFPHNILSRDNEIAHFTSSSFILNKELSKFLQVHHKLRNTWAWPGGHADGNSNLLEVAIQEAFEETGINVEPLRNEIASIDILPPAGHIKNGKYVNSHLHLSVAYIFLADDKAALSVKPDENNAVEWFEIEKINESMFHPRDVYLYTKILNQARLWAETQGVNS